MPAARRVGAYAKLLANYASDDAIIAAGEAAELLFVRGLAFCATSDSDGYITDAQVERYVGAGMRDAAKRAEKLSTAGLWERVDGGYMVRSWTKLHETSAEKGRKLKADRERKRFRLESEPDSNRIPSGIPTEGGSDSLSLIQDRTDTGQNTTTVEGLLGGERPEPFDETPATNLHHTRCLKHRNGNPTNEPCAGCRADRVADEKFEAKVKAELATRLRDCRVCEGMGFELDDERKPTRRKCTAHLEAAS